VTVELRAVNVGYDGDPVLRDVTLDVADGEVVSLLGPNGVGKTTLLQSLCGLQTPLSGTVSVGGVNVADLSREALSRRVSYVSQNDRPNHPANAFETVLMGRKPYLSWKPSESDRERVAEVLDQLDVVDLAMRDVRRLSEGQRQKVMLARALAQDPDVLVLDEPTSNLDIRRELEVLSLLAGEATDGITAVMAMHDLNLAARYSDRLVLLADGGVFDSGGPEILTPETIEAVYGVTARVVRDEGHVTVVPEGPADGRSTVDFPTR